MLAAEGDRRDPPGDRRHPRAHHPDINQVEVAITPSTSQCGSRSSGEIN
jgi:hypothetical protein